MLGMLFKVLGYSKEQTVGIWRKACTQPQMNRHLLSCYCLFFSHKQIVLLAFHDLAEYLEQPFKTLCQGRLLQVWDLFASISIAEQQLHR